MPAARLGGRIHSWVRGMWPARMRPRAPIARSFRSSSARGVEVTPPARVRFQVTVPDDLLALGLKHPIQARGRLEQLARAHYGADADSLDREASINYPREVFEIPHERLWNTPHEKIIRQTVADLVALLDTYKPADLGRHTVFLDKNYFRLYLYMNAARVLNLHEALLRKGFQAGKLLEVGSFFGSFALALQRLGYQVTAVDRYGCYGQAFTAYTDLMAREGVEVVSTHRESEVQIIESLSTRFDCVLSAAVIEHIPHTPRLFLEMLSRRCRPGGIMAHDTPNLTRYWNRERFRRGESTYQGLADQFHCDIPYEGHHREYTGSEMVWMMEQVGCSDVELTYFDYNMFQFPRIDRPHLMCLLNVIREPALADTILVCGQRSRA